MLCRRWDSNPHEVALTEDGARCCVTPRFYEPLCVCLRGSACAAPSSRKTSSSRVPVHYESGDFTVSGCAELLGITEASASQIPVRYAAPRARS